MSKYLFTSDQLSKLLDKTIDRFLEYQFKHGYEEPRARMETLKDMMGELRPEASGGTGSK